MEGDWTLWLDLEGRPGFRNMAIDQALLARAGARGERWLRLYRWSPHCLSFGRHEPAARRYDRERAAALGLDVVRRPTGGRAVWHAEELTYAVALPVAGLGPVRAVCEEVHRMLRDALALLGVAVEPAPAGRAAGLGSGACFGRPAGGELLLGGRKVVGSAQLREAGGLLQHGAILLAGDQGVVTAVTRGLAPSDGAAPLASALGYRPDPAQVARVVGAAAEARWGGTWRSVTAPAGALLEAAVLEPRFRSHDWTWGR